MADEPKPTIDMKEEAKKTERIVEPQKQETPKPETLKETKPVEAPKKEAHKEETKQDTPKEKPKEPKKSKTPKKKKSKAIVKGISVHISTKKSMGICKFIKGKTIESAISNLELVLQKKKAVPIKGEIPHKKGLGKIASGSGSYPKKAAEQFIKLLNSLQANADVNGLDEPIITEVFANFASRPLGRFGRVKRKRTHIQITVKEKKKLMKNKKDKKKWKKGK